MATITEKKGFLHVYVMLSIDGLVKVGITENIISRAFCEHFGNEKKEIVSICYSTEKLSTKNARICEAALLGFHRRCLVNQAGEWLTAQYKSVVETLNIMLNGKIAEIQANGDNCQRVFNDEFMKNKGYTRRYLGKRQRNYYLKCEDGVCYLVIQAMPGMSEILVCSLPLEEMMDYLTENDFKLAKKL